jgi:GATA-binding protein, other eukaryote
MPSSLLNSNDYYSPPGSAYPSAVSTPQPIPENQDVYFQQRGIDMRHQRPHIFSHGPSSLSNSMAPQYMYNANGGPMFTAVTAGGQSNSFTPRYFGMTQHIDPSQIFQSDHPARPPGVHMGNENMFSFGADSDGDEEEGGAFADRIMKHESAPSPMEDPSMEMEPGSFQWDAGLTGQFNTQAARYPGGPHKKQVTIGGTADMESVEGDGSGGSLGRTHASTQSDSDNRSRNGNDRRQNIPQTASTPNKALMGQPASMLEQMSNPISPPDPSKCFESAISWRIKARLFDESCWCSCSGREWRSNDLHELCNAEYTPLATKPGRPLTLQRLWTLPKASRCRATPCNENRCHQEAQPRLRFRPFFSS